MPGLVHLLRCLGRAAVKNGGRALASLVPFGEIAYEIARDACEEYRKTYGEAALRAELDRLGRASPTEVRQAAEEVAAGEPAALRLALVSYLDQAPANLPTLLPAGEPAARAASVDLPLLQGPTRAYPLRQLLAEGDSADVYLAGEHLLKVSRTPQNAGRLFTESKFLTHLLSQAGDSTYRRYLPALLESFPNPQGRVNVFFHEPGFSTLAQVHARHPALDGRHLAWIFKRLLTVLGFCHRQGIVHAGVLPEHVLLHAENHGLKLVGWGGSIHAGRVLTTPPRQRDWYPPEALGSQPVGPATDLYLAARCVVWLAGEKAMKENSNESVPSLMRQFLGTCLYDSARMRPDDAWALLDDFDGLLRRLYGPARYQTLTMT